MYTPPHTSHTYGCIKETVAEFIVPKKIYRCVRRIVCPKSATHTFQLAFARLCAYTAIGSTGKIYRAGVQMCNVGPRAWQCAIVPAGTSGFSHLCRTLGPSAGQREKHAGALLICVSGYHRGSRHDSEPLRPPSKSPIDALTQI